MFAFRTLGVLLVSTVLAWPAMVPAAEQQAAGRPFAADPEDEELTAPVSLDGVGIPGTPY